EGEAAGGFHTVSVPHEIWRRLSSMVRKLPISRDVLLKKNPRPWAWGSSKRMENPLVALEVRAVDGSGKRSREYFSGPRAVYAELLRSRRARKRCRSDPCRAV